MQPTLESSTIQTAEPIVKFHTILEMGSHNEFAHTFRSQSLIFGSALKRGFKKLFTVFFSSEFYHQTRATIARHHTCGAGWQSAVPCYEDDFESHLHYEGTADVRSCDQ